MPYKTLALVCALGITCTSFGMELKVKVLRSAEEFQDALLQAKQNYEAVNKTHKPPISPAYISNLLHIQHRFDLSIEVDGKIIGFFATHSNPHNPEIILMDQIIRGPDASARRLLYAFNYFLNHNNPNNDNDNNDNE